MIRSSSVGQQHESPAVQFNLLHTQLNFTTGESCRWTTLAECINYSPLKRASKCWNMLGWMYSVDKVWFNNIRLHLSVLVDMVSENRTSADVEIFPMAETSSLINLSIWRSVLNFTQTVQNSDIKRSHHKSRRTHAVMQQPVQTVMLRCISAEYSQLQNRTAELRSRFSLQNNLKFLRHKTQLGSSEHLWADINCCCWKCQGGRLKLLPCYLFLLSLWGVVLLKSAHGGKTVRFLVKSIRNRRIQETDFL